MSNARENIFANIRRALRASEGDATREETVEHRMAAARPGIQPARGQGSLEQRLETFTRQAQNVSATLARVRSDSDVAAEVARYLRSHNLPLAVRTGQDGRLSVLDWRGANIDISHGPSAGQDLNAVSHAEGGIAETGTLALVSGPHNPTSLNFLPDNHIVVVRAKAILATYEDVFATIRSRFGKGIMPRTVNLITGPSRSADIEQKLLLGAHGPRRLHIVIVEGEK